MRTLTRWGEPSPGGANPHICILFFRDVKSEIGKRGEWNLPQSLKFAAFNVRGFSTNVKKMGKINKMFLRQKLDASQRGRVRLFLVRWLALREGGRGKGWLCY